MVIGHLKERGLNGSVVAGWYHRQRFVPLMALSLVMFQMTPENRVVGANMMPQLLLPDEEV